MCGPGQGNVQGWVPVELSEGHVVGGNAHLCFFPALPSHSTAQGSLLIMRLPGHISCRLLPSEHRHCRELRLDLGSSESFPRIGEFGDSQNPFQMTLKISLLLLCDRETTSSPPGMRPRPQWCQVLTTGWPVEFSPSIIILTPLYALPRHTEDTQHVLDPFPFIPASTLHPSNQSSSSPAPPLLSLLPLRPSFTLLISPPYPYLGIFPVILTSFLTVICLSWHFTWRTVFSNELTSLEHRAWVTLWSTLQLSDTRDLGLFQQSSV